MNSIEIPLRDTDDEVSFGIRILLYCLLNPLLCFIILVYVGYRAELRSITRWKRNTWGVEARKCSFKYMGNISGKFTSKLIDITIFLHLFIGVHCLF